MKTTQLIREEFGLSQLVLAQYLSISLSQLAMYETGKRDLPAKTLIKIADLILFLNQNKEVFQEKNLLLKSQESKKDNFIIHQEKDLEYKIQKEQRKLDIILKKHNQNLKLNALINHFEKRNIKQDTIILKLAIKEIEKNSLTVQLKQVLKLEGFKSQLNYLQTLKIKSNH